MTATLSALDVAEQFFTAIPKGDLEAIRALYHPDVVVWHNNGNQSQTRDENLRVLRWVGRILTDLRYEEIRRCEIPGGFLQQHVLRGTNGAGEKVEVHACIVCKVDDGLITRLDEYIDSAQIAGFR